MFLGAMSSLKVFTYSSVYAGREQSMKIDDRKMNRSIDDNRLITADCQSMIKSHLGGRELHRLPSIGTKFMSPYLQVSRKGTQIIYYF